MNKLPLFILWFKRDLRLRDNRALQAAVAATQAVAGARLLLLYVFEPALLADPHYELRHWRFVRESLADLNRQLRRVGPATPLSLSEWPAAPAADLGEAAGAAGAAQVLVVQRELVALLTELARTYALHGLFSHQETGLRITYRRDQAVAAFCQEQGVGWHQFRTNGVIRRLGQRASWRPRYYASMAAPQQHPNLAALHARAVAAFQPGGEVGAHAYLHSFLTGRVDGYLEALPSPLASRTHGSRLSPLSRAGGRGSSHRQGRARRPVGVPRRP